MNNAIEVIGIEIYAKEGKQVPIGRNYKIRIDKTQYTVSVHKMTGREILTLDGKKPEQFILRQKIRGQVVRIELDQVVDFTAPGVERFMTIPNEVTEGEADLMRHDFELMQDC